MTVLRQSTAWKVLFRSLFLQAGFHQSGMQMFGVLFALRPALDELYETKEAREAATARHAVPFNTHPYVATAILGAVLFHEQRIAGGQEPADKVVALKKALMGPLAALGDGVVWLSWRPFVGALSAGVALWSPWVAVALYVVVYNALQVWIRGVLFFAALSQGEAIVLRQPRQLIARGQIVLRSGALVLAGAGLCFAMLKLIIW
jgi:PTS system mannose-specific IID component